MSLLNLGARARALASASSLSLACGCSLQDFDPLSAGIGSSGTGGSLPEAGVGSSGSGGSSGGNGGSAGDGGDGGTQAGQGGSGGSDLGGDGGDGGAPPVDPGNLMSDPSFETGTSGWAVFGTSTVARVQSEARTGASSLLCSSREENWNGATLPLASLTSADETYTLTAWVRLAEVADAGAPAAPPELSLTLKTRCGTETDNDTVPYEILSTVSLTDTWTLITGSTPPRRCPTPADYRIYFSQPEGALAPFPDFHIDDVSFTANDP